MYPVDLTLQTHYRNFMKTTENLARAVKITKMLRSAYPHVKTQLHFQNPFELLVATILSAQCTDKQVNKVTQNLFTRLKTPRSFVDAPLEVIEEFIRPTGYYHNKAKSIKKCAQALLEVHNGAVPGTLEELIKLPGVGRKTANVVLGAAFGIPGIVVDTHVARIAQRLGMTENKDPVKIEFDLMRTIPKKDWSDFSLLLIYLGREYCIARNPRCSRCPINRLCPWPEKSEPEAK